MRKCNDGNCETVCDFCKHYQENKESVVFMDRVEEIDVGKGFCTQHCQIKKRNDTCNDFHCRWATERDK